MVYIHIPFCRHRCIYCAFHSSVNHQWQADYVAALDAEMAQRHAEAPAPTTLYLGGGTPSCLPVPLLQQLAKSIGKHFDVGHLQEVTIEANPEDLTPEYLQALRHTGLFNRISLGIQSLDDSVLRTLNRRHTADQALQAVANALHAGFDNISIDLIYGLPGQTLASWEETLARVPEGITHLSAYALSIEPSTVLQFQVEKGLLSPADEQLVDAQYQRLQQWAASRHLEQYEISNFALPHRESRHNSRYWNRTPYLGLGAAAHSLTPDGRRRWNIANTQQYIQSLLLHHPTPYWEEETLSPTDIYNEQVMLGLRTVAGIEKSAIAPTLLPHLQSAIAPYITHNLIQDTPTHYRPTPEGLLHADGIAAELMMEE